MQDFRRLHVWVRAHALTLAIRQATATFPRVGTASLRSQLIRAADSIATNIVEGCGASTAREFARFLDIAIKSATECEYHLLLAHDSGALGSARWRTLSTEVIEIRRMLYGLRRQVLLRADRGEGKPR